MQSFISYCYGDETSRNKPVYKDGTFWTMLGVTAASMVVASMAALPSRLARYSTRASALFDKELFFISVPEWVLPVFYLIAYVCTFLAVYFMYRRINANTDISYDRRNKAKSYTWLLFIIMMVANPLWSWTYLGMGEPAFAFLFLAVLFAALACLMVMHGLEKWGGKMTGAWYLYLTPLIYYLAIALPLNFQSAFTKDGKTKFKNRSQRKSGSGRSSGSAGFSVLSSLAP
jgi:tryptophan-rich sensory protein